MIADLLGRPVCWVDLGDVIPSERPPSSVVVLSLVGRAAPESVRMRALRELSAALAPGEPVAAVDHNRPRRAWAAVAALLGAPWVPVFAPGARWRRLAHPTAREMQGAGLIVDGLRFAAGERVQIVFATRR